MTNPEENLGYTFQNKKLLETALQHSSYANEKSCESYERLEFLGDSILGMVVAEHLFHSDPQLPEGDLTRHRAAFVREENLVLVAHRLGLVEEIRLGRGEIKHGSQPSVQADVVEAVLAAMYLDGGLEPVRRVIEKHILSHSPTEDLSNMDYKSALQELLQKKLPCVIEYRKTGEEGPDHQKQFFMEILYNGTVYGSGTGKTKKESQQQAAKEALAILRHDSQFNS